MTKAQQNKNIQKLYNWYPTSNPPNINMLIKLASMQIPLEIGIYDEITDVYFTCARAAAYILRIRGEVFFCCNKVCT